MIHQCFYMHLRVQVSTDDPWNSTVCLWICDGLTRRVGVCGVCLVVETSCSELLWTSAPLWTDDPQTSTESCRQQRMQTELYVLLDPLPRQLAPSSLMCSVMPMNADWQLHITAQHTVSFAKIHNMNIILCHKKKQKLQHSKYNKLWEHSSVLNIKISQSATWWMKLRIGASCGFTQ